MATHTDGVTTLPGQEPVYNISPGRAAALKLQSVQTGESVMVFEEVAPAGADTQLHLHHHSDEVMYVLSGEFTFQIGDQVSAGGPGACVFMPRGIPHAWKNSGNDTGRVLCLYAPAEVGKVVEELSRVQRPFAEIVNDPDGAETFRRHGWEFLGPSPF
jgi:quercetin dioxygenase-like cupin family protein